jgi:hypothetical protein
MLENRSIILAMVKRKFKTVKILQFCTSQISILYDVNIQIYTKIVVCQKITDDYCILSKVSV